MFPVKYGLDSYILFRRNPVFKGLTHVPAATNRRFVKNKYPWQRIDTVIDEPFEVVIYIRFTSKL
jgi:hypothetical protein